MSPLESQGIAPQSWVRALTLCLLAAGCATGSPTTVPLLAAELPRPAERTPWTSLEAKDAASDFDFVVVTDRTGEHREGVFAGAMPKVNLLEPAFVMSVGDLIEGYTEDREELAKQWDEIEGFVAKLDMPFFYLPGNHDMSNETMARIWAERFGASYYHFVYKDVLFIGLNSELFGMVHDPRKPVPGPDEQAEQMAWLEGLLLRNGDVRWTFVFVHQPLWDSPSIHPDWLQVEEWLGPRPYTVFAGHYHAYTRHVRHDRSFLTLATTGGGSAMRGSLHGEFDHVVMVSMREGGPTLANVMLDGIEGEDVRSEEERALVRTLEHMVRPQPMQFNGVGRGDAADFSRGTVTFVAENTTDAPVEIAGRVEPSRDFAARQPQIQLTLAAGAREEIGIALDAKRRVAFGELAAARVRWSLRTVGSDGETIELESQSSIAPDRTFACPAPLGDIVVDGVLGEWGALPMSASAPSQVEHAEHHEGPADGSFRFGIRCADDFVYIAVDALDDSIVHSPDVIAREQDGLSLTLDARPDPQRSAAGRGTMAALVDGSFASVLTIEAGPEANPAKDAVLSTFLPAAPDGARSSTRRTERGYRTEFAVPVSALDTMRGGPFDFLRIDISQLDFDEGESGHSTIWWRPSRFSTRSVPGSGTFLRR